MNKISKLTGVLAAFVFISITDVDAALVQTGTRAGTEIADCAGSCTNYNFGPNFGGAGKSISGVSSVSDLRGNARANAFLGGGLSTPVLQAGAFANGSFKGAFGSAFGVQSYTYLGPGEVLTLNVNLDGLVQDPEEDADDTRASLEVVFYAPEPFSFGSSRQILENNIGVTPLVQPDLTEASVFLQLDHLNPSNDSGQISVEVVTGDEFYIWAFLFAEARSGLVRETSANALNTGTMSFVGNPNLVAASPVPLPAAIYFLGFGVFVLSRKKVFILSSPLLPSRR